MRKTILTLMLACAGQLLAGGFFLQVGNPEANAEARKMGAAVTIKAAGCHDPSTATVTATAIGLVKGQRRTKRRQHSATHAKDRGGWVRHHDDSRSRTADDQ